MSDTSIRRRRPPVHQMAAIAVGLTVVVLMVVGTVWMPAAGAAEPPGATATSLTAPAQATRRVPVTFGAHVSAVDGTVPTGTVRFEQQVPSGWTPLGDVGVDAAGNAALTTSFDAASQVVRASYLGTDETAPSTSEAAAVAGVPQATTIRLNAPRAVRDERTLKLSAKVRTPHVAAVPGAEVSFQVLQGTTWTTYATARTDAAGVARVRSKPRRTYRYRAVVTAADWYTAAASTRRTVTNRPPGKVIRLPRAAPQPKRRLPAQLRATGGGAHATVSSISDAVWKDMTGRSWRSGCPVGRASLRIVRVNYWGFDGYRHRGELVVHRSIAGKTARAFSDLYRHRVAIRSMYRIDRFAFSSRVKGADDYASMAADNTSAFNCRNVVGRPGVRSPHTYGTAIDINPFENPYRYSAGRWVPNTWWHRHAAGTYAWTKRSHLVPRIMRRNGFRWTYGNLDAQHFDG